MNATTNAWRWIASRRSGRAADVYKDCARIAEEWAAMNERVGNADTKERAERYLYAAAQLRAVAATFLKGVQP